MYYFCLSDSLIDVLHFLLRRTKINNKINKISTASKYLNCQLSVTLSPVCATYYLVNCQLTIPMYTPACLKTEFKIYTTKYLMYYGKMCQVSSRKSFAVG